MTDAKLRSMKIVKTKVALATTTDNIFFTKVNNLNQHSYILILADIYKKSFYFSIVFITYNKNESEKQVPVN